MSLRVCSQPGCPVLTNTAGRCPAHAKAADKARGTATQRGYNTRGHRSFRRDVLARDPVCMICHKAMSTVADHHPASRRDLLTQGRNPDDPNAGRGLCKRCHDTHTATEQPGGWNQRDSCGIPPDD